MTQVKRFYVKNAIVMMCVSTFLVGCAPTIDSRGVQPDEIKMANIKVGIDRKGSVLEKLGSPSTQAGFNQNIWYYIHKTTSQSAFFMPDTMDQEILVVTFNGDVVSDVTLLKGTEAKAIKPSQAKTPTSGYDSGVLRQVLGNFGRLGSGGKKAGV